MATEVKLFSRKFGLEPLPVFRKGLFCSLKRTHMQNRGFDGIVQLIMEGVYFMGCL